MANTVLSQVDPSFRPLCNHAFGLADEISEKVWLAAMQARIASEAWYLWRMQFPQNEPLEGVDA